MCSLDASFCDNGEKLRAELIAGVSSTVTAVIMIIIVVAIIFHNQRYDLIAV